MQASLSGEALTLVEKFISGAVVIPVSDSGTTEAGRLRVTPGISGKYDLLKKAAMACMSAIGHVDRTGELLEGFFNNRFKDDLWFMCPKTGPTIILVKEAVYRQLSEREIAQQVHKEEVECAAQRGEPVPDDLLFYYRNLSRPVFSPPSAM